MSRERPPNKPPKPPTRRPSKAGPALRCYVYGILDGDDLVYIGKGTGRRWRESLKERRGTEGIVFVEGLSSGEALDQERVLIAHLQPPRNIAPGQRSELERTKAFAKQMLADIFPFDVWLALTPRTPEEITLVRRILKELREMAEHGWKSKHTLVLRADSTKGEASAA